MIEGSIHGRFQPFHLGHLEYALAAADRCDFLWVGITQPSIVDLTEHADDHRFRSDDNPLAYWERAVVVDEALSRAGLDRGQFRIVPFPIEQPALIRNYVPITATAFTTICEPWNRQKIEILRAEGFLVEVLWERENKEPSGGQVRAAIRAGGDGWRDLVPEGTASAMERLGIAQLIRGLR